MNLKLPTITLPVIRRTRCLSVQCGLCRLWVKPRYLRVPTMICRDCEATGRHQTWKPSEAHLQRAYASVAAERARLRQMAGAR